MTAKIFIFYDKQPTKKILQGHFLLYKQCQQCVNTIVKLIIHSFFTVYLADRQLLPQEQVVTVKQFQCPSLHLHESCENQCMHHQFFHELRYHKSCSLKFYYSFEKYTLNKQEEIIEIYKETTSIEIQSIRHNYIACMFNLSTFFTCLSQFRNL